LLAQRELPRTKRLIQFRLDDPDRRLHHDEPIYRNGELVGRTSSGMWSYAEGACLAMGYLVREDDSGEGVTQEWLDAGHFEIEVATVRVPAATSIRSLYDPRNTRVRM
ncbi:MAG: glycine cleavage T C-terminal barrel domain-containing protein, partial [Ilumatobacter sp.]